MEKSRSARPWDLFNLSIDHVSKEIVEKRLSVCDGCEHMFKATKQCKKCGCFMTLKAKLPHSECPVGKWGQEVPENYVI
jgi:hypothetical protein